MTAPMTTPMTGYSAQQPAKVLCSFHYYRKDDIAGIAAGHTLVMGDSGAFTAAASGQPIVYAEYTAWLRRWGPALFSYPCLDVIGDPDVTWTGYRRMRRDGLAPLPVYHYGSPLVHLRRYLDAGERYIALGGLVGKRGPDVTRWIIACFQAAQPYGAVFHGFGRTRAADLAAFPWYSVDSSNLTRGARFGLVDLFDGHRFISLKRSEPRTLYAHGALLRDHGSNPADLDNRNPRSRRAAYRAAVIAYRRCEEWMRLRHGPVPGPRPGDPAGPHVFLADAPVTNINHIKEAVAYQPGPYYPHRWSTT
jgi:hypothetical protein